MRFRYGLRYRLGYRPKGSVSDLNQNSGFGRTLNLTLIPTNCSWSTTQESRYTNEMLVAKRAMTSVHPSALSALMYRKFVNSQRKENPHDLQQNFPAKINTKHYDYPLGSGIWIDNFVFFCKEDPHDLLQNLSVIILWEVAFRFIILQFSPNGVVHKLRWQDFVFFWPPTPLHWHDLQ